MWAYLQEEADLINNDRKCKLLPNAEIPENIKNKAIDVCSSDKE